MKKQVLFIVLMFMPLMASADPVQIGGIYYNLITKAKQAEVTSGPDTQEMLLFLRMWNTREFHTQ